MTVTNEQRLQQVMDEQRDAAQQVCLDLMDAVRRMQPMPSPLVTAIACRYLQLYAAQSLINSSKNDPVQVQAIVEAFNAIDEGTCVERLVSGDVTVDQEVVAEVMAGKRGPLRVPEEDPSVFDIDAWDEEKRP